MNYMKYWLFLAAALLLSAHAPVTETVLTIKVRNIKKATGNLRIGIYTQNNNFPKNEDTYKNKIYKIPKTGILTVKISDLPHGKYALALHHDENANNRMDYNLIGAPLEPFAFSNNIRPRFAAPPFETCAFDFYKNEVVLDLTLIEFLR
jgi:uncharacterized protein (DUF2141 family)